jgi:iron complex outermembrane recepter protein
MSKVFTTLTCILFINIFVLAQTNKAVIRGTIEKPDGKPAELADVVVKGTSIGSTTNSEGVFVVRNLSPGKYVLRISFLGYQTEDIKVSAGSGENLLGKIILKESAPQLQTVLVKENKINKFKSEESEYVAKINIRNIENPQSYSTTSQAVLEEQNVTNFADALQTVPGENVSSQNGQGLLGTFIRGFLTNAFIRNGMYQFDVNGGDPENIERIEVIKGPSGPIYGSWGIGYGGLIDVVTKKPFNGKYYRVGSTFGSYNLQRYYADVNLPLNGDTTLLMRVNAAVNSQGSFQDYGYEKTYMIAPSFSYKLSDKVNILFEVELNNIDLSANTIFSGEANLGKSSIDQIRTDYFKSYSSDKLTHPPTTLNNYYGKLNYEISDNWNLNTSFALSDCSFNGSVVVPNFLNDSLMSRTFADYGEQINTVDIQPDINGEFYIGNIKNHFLAGFDYQWVQVITSASYVINADTLDYTKSFMPVLNVPLLRTQYNYLLRTNESRNSYGLYFSNVADLTDRLGLMVSLRYDYDNYRGDKDLIHGGYTSTPYNQGTYSPQAGLTYQIFKNQLSLFTNYMQGFDYITSNLQGQGFKPILVRQEEGGVKMNLLDSRLASTISYYNIEVSNTVRVDPNNPLLSIQDGNQQSRGVDVDLRINPVDGLNILTGYDYNESKFLKANASVQGKRPHGVPKNMSNLWASYGFTGGFLKGFGIGAGLNYTGSYYYDDANTLSIPSYLLFKASLFYFYNNIKVGVSGNNITGVKYWDYNGTPQAPGTYSIDVNFNI